MELELGLKITQTRDGFTSTTEFRMAKDPTLPIFTSTETQSNFILTAHLKGYGKDEIGIKINEDGTQIAIRLKKAVEEMVMSTWIVPNKELKMKDFITVFKIPNGVVLDGIKAKFDEQDSILTILLPKLTNGIQGEKIEQVKQDRDDAICENVEEPNQGTSQTTMKNVIEEETRIKERREMEAYYEEPSVIKPNEETKLESELVMLQLKEPSKESDEVPTQQIQNPKLVVESGDFGSKGNGSTTLDEIVEERKSFKKVKEELLEDIEAMVRSTKHESDGLPEKHLDKRVVEDETQKVDQVKEGYKKDDIVEEKKEPKKIILCKPCVIAGSAIIASLVVIAIHWIRSRKRQVQ